MTPICVYQAHYNVVVLVLVNGTPTDFFKASRGLSQGCPLSPLLFLLLIEGPSILISNAQMTGTFRGICINGSFAITHILFVDDVLIFGTGHWDDWVALRNVLVLFSDASGMSINMQKSSFLYHSISQDL